MKKKIGTISVLIVALILVVSIFIIKTNLKNISDENKMTITISIFDKDNKNIYKEDIETNKTYLIDVLEGKENLKVVAEDSQYGKYITSIMGIEQGEDYYWSYYIDNQYANIGVSECKIEKNKHYSFKIEKFIY